MVSLLSVKAPDVGTTVRITQEFYTLDPTPLLVDPVTIQLTFEDPQGFRYALNAIRQSQGVYYADIVVQISGQWRYRWETSTPQIAEEGSFIVRRSEIVQPNGFDGLPVRFADFYFFYEDQLDVKFKFRTLTADGMGTQPLDLSLYFFRAVAKSDEHDELPLVFQPELDMSEASDGFMWVRWTAQQVESLPSSFWLEISEFSGWDDADDPLSDGQIWDDLPDIDWNQLPEFTWDEFPDHVHPAAIWDSTILVGRFIRNTDGF